MLLLLLLLQGALADLNWQHATLSNSTCNDLVSQPLQQSEFWKDDSNQNVAYNFEGSMLNRTNNNSCQFCPYHEYMDPLSDADYSKDAMYGPCLNNELPMRMQCHDHFKALYADVYGRVFFPDQRPLYEAFLPPSTGVRDTELIDLYANGTTNKLKYKYPMHRLMRDMYGYEVSNVDENGDTLDPTHYGITLHNFLQVSSIEGDRVQEIVKQWMYIAQGFCDYGCHRGQALKFRHLTAQNARLVDTTLAEEEQDITICEDCAAGHMSYWWPNRNYMQGVFNNDRPKPFQAWPFTSQCWPFFGVIPILKQTNPKELDGTRSVPCPVNHYWRSCAHHYLRYTKDHRGVEPGCKACPVEWHTNGKTGQWYCTPPLGMIFTSPLGLQINAIWRRDLVKEPQCVSCDAAGCNQFSDAPYPAESYNEETIFKDMLEVKACEQGYYCPDALQLVQQQACPPSMPWSPAGSFSEDNCTCGAGQYRLNRTACAPCATQCQLGYSLVKAECGKGSTSNSVCRPCPNVPANATAIKRPYQVWGADSYFEDIVQGAVTIAKCHYQCNRGFYMDSEGACIALDQLTAGGMPTLLFDSHGAVFCPDLYESGQDYYYYDDTSTGQAVTFILNKVIEWRNNPTKCAQARMSCVSEEAQRGTWAWDRDLLCVACPAKPAGTVWTPTAKAWSPTNGASEACKFTCEADKYLLSDNSACANCSSYPCSSPSQRVMGRGCGGDTSPELTCVTCILTAAQCMNTQWLHIGSTTPTAVAQGGCACEDCAELPEGYYWKQTCGGTSPGVRVVQTVGCSPNQFLTGVYSATSTKTCRNCTSFSPGHYLPEGDDSLCTSEQDAGWLPCPAGSYCAGAPISTPTSCPTGRTSFVAAVTVEECFCALGTTAQGPTACQTVTCDDTVPLTDMPGAITRSPYFYTLRDDQRTTTCELCGSGAYAQGSKQGLTSCTCIAESYVLNASHACVPCTTTPIQCTQGSVPLPCRANTGQLQLQQCGCAMPPFTVLRAGIGECVSQCNTPCAAKCDPRFSTATLTSDPALRNVTGSGLYSVDQWVTVLTTSLNITALHVTSDQDDRANGIQYVLWATNDSYLHVASTTAPILHQFLMASADTTLATIACSRFKSVQQQRVTRIIVAAVLQNAAGLVASVATRTLDLDANNDITEPPSASLSFMPIASTMQGAELVHLQHVTYPQGGFCAVYNRGQDSYIAYQSYNENNGIVTGWEPHPTSLLLTSVYVPAGRVAAAVIQERYEDRSIYLVMQSTPTQILSLMWLTSSSGFTQPSTYYSSAQQLSWLSTFSMLDPLLLTIATGGKPHVMDSTQMQFVPIEGFPPDALVSSRLVHFSMQTSNSTHMRAQAVAATGRSVFSLQLFFCKTVSTQRKYWNGTACVPIVCQRKPQCTATQHPAADGQCVCNLGYRDAGQDCVTCAKDNYCTSGVQTACPSSLSTSTLALPTGTGRQKVQDCVCGTLPSALYYATPTCRQCVSPHFCPDQWHNQLCPGGTYVYGTSEVEGQAQTTPVACRCAPGFTGVACTPCPSNMVCPMSTTTVYNSAIVLMGPSTVDVSACVVSTLTDAFEQATQSTNYDEWHTAATRPDGTLVISILFQTMSSSVHDLLKTQVPGLADLKFRTTLTPPCQFNMNARFPTQTIMSYWQGAANVPVACGTGSTPAEDAVSCTCAAGYATDVAQTCKICAANTYKALSGPGACQPCEKGTVSNAGSSACAPPVENTRRTSAAAATQYTLTVLSLSLVSFLCFTHSLC